MADWEWGCLSELIARGIVQAFQFGITSIWNLFERF